MQSTEQVLELMARRIEDVGLYHGSDPHHGRGVAVPPTILGAWDWARTQIRPDWRTRGDEGLWEQFHAVCFEALHRLALHVADQPVAPEWWSVGQKAWESHVIHVWGEFHDAVEAVSAIRSAAGGRVVGPNGPTAGVICRTNDTGEGSETDVQSNG